MSRARVLPGFGLSLGYAVAYLSLVVLLPLAALLQQAAGGGLHGYLAAVWTPRVLASFKLTFGTAALAALLNAVFGTVVAWTLVRYRFPLRTLVDALVDLPFALPTAVSGIALANLYGPHGWIGRELARWGLKVVYTPLGIVVALTFIGLPFVVRTLQPALEDLEPELEEAAASLGADRWQTIWRVVLPAVLPALLTGFALAFARAIGEYGSVVFIAGNMPMRTEIASLLIITKLEQYDYSGAAAIGVAMLFCSFVLLLGINLLQWLCSRRAGRGGPA